MADCDLWTVPVGCGRPFDRELRALRIGRGVPADRGARHAGLSWPDGLPGRPRRRPWDSSSWAGALARREGA